MAAAQMEEIPPRLGEYRLLRCLAKGGMGEVFLARKDGPAEPSTVVVVKRLLPNLAKDPDIVEGFLSEARLAAWLHHPNIVQTFDLGEDRGDYYIAMEYVHGRSLSAIRESHSRKFKAPVPPEMAAHLVAQALHGLEHAHDARDEQGRPMCLVHRDVSPDNVLVSYDGRVKVADFGIAKARNIASTTRTGFLKGKPGYMAPEQVRLKRLDLRTDIFAMGCVLYELLSGKRPFERPTAMETFHAIVNAPHLALRSGRTDLPEAFEEIVSRALAKAPEGRYQSAREMATALESWLTGCGHAIDREAVAAFLRQIYGKETSEAIPAAAAAPLPIRENLPEDDPAATIDERGRKEAMTSEVSRPGPSGDGPGSWRAAALEEPLGARTLIDDERSSATRKVQRRLDEEVPTEPADGITSPVHRRLARRRNAWRSVAAACAVAGAIIVGLVVASMLARRPTPDREPVPAVPPAAERVKRARMPPSESNAPPAQPSSPSPSSGVERAPRTLPPAAENGPGTGTVAMRISPWAEVFLDGRSLGVTPMSPVEVPAGQRVFVLKNPELGVEREVRLKVPAGGQVTLRADLFGQPH